MFADNALIVLERFMANCAVGVLLVGGFAFQIIGIYKGTSTIRNFRQELRESSKNWFERLARRGNTAAVNATATKPQLVAALTNQPRAGATCGEVTAWLSEHIKGIGEQNAAVLSELNNLKERIKGEETQRSEADKLFQGFVIKTEWAAWFIFLGTLLLALAEGVR